MFLLLLRTPGIQLYLRVNFGCVLPRACVFCFSGEFGNVSYQKRAFKKQQLFPKGKAVKSFRKVGHQLFSKLNMSGIFLLLFCSKRLGK